MKRLIAGIDPGTTTGYALLGLDGKPVDIDSSKKYDLKELLKAFTEKGKVILIGTDKKNLPSFVHKAGASLGAGLVWPREDLKISDKKELVKGMRYSDDHQRDALASAMFAHNQFKPLFDKVDHELRKRGREEISEDVKELMIKNDHMNIDAAVRSLEPAKEEKPNIKIAREDADVRTTRLREEMRALIQQNRVLRTENQRLRQEISDITKEKSRLEDRYFTKRDKSKSEMLKEDQIKKLSQIIDEKEKEKEAAKEETRDLSRLISDSELIPLKIMRNLGSKEYERKAKAIRINKDDMLFVEDVSITSQKTIDELRKKISLIVYMKGPNKHIPFLQLDSQGLDIIRTGHYAFADRKQLEKKKNTSQLLQNIIDLHRSHRR